MVVSVGVSLAVSVGVSRMFCWLFQLGFGGGLREVRGRWRLHLGSHLSTAAAATARFVDNSDDDRELLKTPVEEWYEGKVTCHDHFDAVGQIDDTINLVPVEWTEENQRRLRTSCFGHLLTMPRPVKFSGGIIHQLLLREVHHIGPSDEMRFMLGSYEVRLSKVEFCLITGLRFRVVPDTRNYVSMDNGLHHRYFGGKDEISSFELRDA
ncbi:hypothetical protein Ddye_011986 [Dipteronia dyeriana]|uniref:Uncharacterized protein n=1 Tax=Dipteronia dyeriana TaxID=168575 RepID=A0AAD9X3L5_9ROSI|nr:hypothetical protein Ddye_011986 [Dipteronia dyeriana]